MAVICGIVITDDNLTGDGQVEVNASILEITIIIASIFIFVYLYWRFRDPTSGLWSLNNIVYLAAFIVVFYYDKGSSKVMPPAAQFIDWTAFFVGPFFACWGVFKFVNKPFPVLLPVVCIIAIIFNAIHIFYFRNDFTDIFINTFHGVCLVWAGILLIGSRNLSGIWKYISGFLMVLGGVMPLCSFLFSRYSSWGRIHNVLSWSMVYLLYAIIGMVTMLGLLILYYQKRMQNGDGQLALLQAASHELKTQAMVVSNYSKLIVDGVYLGGTLEDSVQVINNEAKKLEKRVRGLLYLSKINSLHEQTPKQDTFDLAELLNESIVRFGWRRKDLTFDSKLESLLMKGDREQWEVVLENILDNQTRYAVSRIAVALNGKKSAENALLRIWNDGAAIDPLIMGKLFHEYQAGKGGEFGLGLVIVKKILEFHQSRIWLANEEQGVAYYIEVNTDLAC